MHADAEKGFMTWKRVLWSLAILGAIAAIAAVVPAAQPPGTGGGSKVPSARVTRGPLKLDVYATGELRASRVASLMAPPAGSSLRLVRMADTGTALRAGDVAMEFDPASQQFAVEQARSELAEADQEIIKMRADVDLRTAQDQVDLLTARFDVRRAELDARADETIIAAVERKKRVLALEEAKRRLAQLEEDVLSRTATSRAALAVVNEKRTKATLSAQRAQQIIDSLVVKTPIDGLVIARENADGINMFYSGMTLPLYRTGDMVGSGRLVLEVHASDRMELRIKVSEQERANVAEGQTASVMADALPGRPFTARVSSIGGSAARGNFFESTSGPLRLFDASLRLDQPDSRLRPGTSVRVVLNGAEVRDALTLPRQAVFQKNGKPVVYARAGTGFAPREVTVTHRTESRVALKGVDEGTEVALVNPEASTTGSRAPATAVPAGGPSR
jgi:HlyD family secretion protein